MALNFPPNPADKTIYIDPSSGLKYLYNGSIGAWETALQPPVITSTDDRPLIQLEGFLWWDHRDKMLYIYKGGDWIPIMSQGGSGEIGVPVVCAPEPPVRAREGWLWWHSVEGNLYVYYVDEPDPVDNMEGDGQWVKVVTNGANQGEFKAISINSEIAPLDPIDGQMWFNTSNQTLYIWDAPSKTWFPAAHGTNISAGVEADLPLEFIQRGNIDYITIRHASTNSTGVAAFASKPDDFDESRRNDLIVSPAYLDAFSRSKLPNIISQDIYDRIKDEVTDLVRQEYMAQVDQLVTERLEEYVKSNFNNLTGRDD